MVATRNHPKDFPEPSSATESPALKASPTKRSTRTSTASASQSTRSAASPPPTPTRVTRSISTRRSSGWSHTPSNLALIWLAVSLPLVLWDMGYVLLRPYSMPGGKFHGPWKPYELYGTVDYVYGLPAWEEKNGWTAAQTLFNLLETLAYLVYLGLVYQYGEQDSAQGRGAPDKSSMGFLSTLSESRTLTGRVAIYAVLLGYSTTFMTFSKTVLYWLIEACSGFANIGHNDWSTLFFLWIIPNGAWIIFPLYLSYVFGQEIIQGLEVATGKKTR